MKSIHRVEKNTWISPHWCIAIRNTTPRYAFNSPSVTSVHSCHIDRGDSCSLCIFPPAYRFVSITISWSKSSVESSMKNPKTVSGTFEPCNCMPVFCPVKATCVGLIKFVTFTQSAGVVPLSSSLPTSLTSAIVSFSELFSSSDWISSSSQLKMKLSLA